MKAILNNEILDWDEIRLSKLNRGFRYGDGFFETIAIVNGTTRFLERHIVRLINGAAKLKLEVHDILNLDQVQKNIQVLQTQNYLEQDSKLKIIIWRNSEGLYTPVDEKTHCLMTIEPNGFHKTALTQRAGFSVDVTNFPSPISKFKSMSAIKYVLAGIEKKEKKLDEIIILDYRAYVSETLSSNIFWRKKNAYYTSPLSTGCIEGIMRNWLMESLKQRGFMMKEKLVKTRELLDSDHIFTTNAMGICHIQGIGRNKFEIDLVAQDIIEKIS